MRSCTVWARLEKLDSPEPWQYADLCSRYDRNVLELYQCLLATQFPDLPQIDGREELLCNLVGTNISEAMWILDCLHKSNSLAGDICEFGIAEGATSALLANEIRLTEKRLWLFDSFEGLFQPTTEDELIDDIFDLGSMAAYAGKMKYDVSNVFNRLKAIGFPEERISIVPGFIEESLKRNPLPSAVSFAYVDFDFYQPIKTALQFLNEVLPKVGLLLLTTMVFSRLERKRLSMNSTVCPGKTTNLFCRQNGRATLRFCIAMVTS